jgi:hypothetical protein
MVRSGVKKVRKRCENGAKWCENGVKSPNLKRQTGRKLKNPDQTRKKFTNDCDSNKTNPE